MPLQSAILSLGKLFAHATLKLDTLQVVAAAT